MTNIDNWRTCDFQTVNILVSHLVSFCHDAVIFDSLVLHSSYVIHIFDSPYSIVSHWFMLFHWGMRYHFRYHLMHLRLLDFNSCDTFLSSVMMSASLSSIHFSRGFQSLLWAIIAHPNKSFHDVCILAFLLIKCHSCDIFLSSFMCSFEKAVFE